MNLRRHILPELGKVELAKLTPSVLRAWLSGLTVKAGAHGGTLSPASVAQIQQDAGDDRHAPGRGPAPAGYRTLNRVLVAAVDNELLGRNPLQGVKPPATPVKPMRFLTHAEVARLGEEIDPRYRALLLVAAYCGLRAGELIALRRSNVDLAHRTITVVEQVQSLHGCFEVLPPKTAAGRRAAALPSLVGESLELHLPAYAEPGPAGIVFPAPEGGYLRLENFRRRVWEPAVSSAGLAPLRLHDMRHCCASLAIAAGADVKVLQRMLGHASAALTLDRYGHLLPGQAEAVAARLDVMARQARCTPVPPTSSPQPAAT